MGEEGGRRMANEQSPEGGPQVVEMPLKVSADWHEHDDPWPPGLCKECGTTFEGSPLRI